MSRDADVQAEVRAGIRKALPVALIERIRRNHYAEWDDQEGAIAASAHLVLLVEQAMIHPDGSLTDHGRATLNDLHAVATWNERVRGKA